MLTPALFPSLLLAPSRLRAAAARLRVLLFVCHVTDPVIPDALVPLRPLQQCPHSL